MKFKYLHFSALFSRTSLLLATSLLTASFALTACDLRTTTAERLAHPAHMYEHQAPQGPFVMTTFERVYAPGGDADVYIEGDARPWLVSHDPALDPTPTNPVALHLATRDDAKNVIYLAEPCQYAGLADGAACNEDAATFDQFGPAMLAAENAALDDLKARYGFRHFNLIGYGGGGAAAILLAARRSDVASLRTVAGALDPAQLARIHDLPPPARGALDPLAAAPAVARIPQHHFIGAWDKTVPATVYDSFRRASGPSTCIRAGTIDGADHDAGWVDKWPFLLKAPLDCHAPESTR